MRTRRAVAGTVLALATSVVSVIPAAQAQARELDLETRLHGSMQHPNARGFTEYERGGGHRELEVSVLARDMARQRVVVMINGHRIARIQLNRFGYGHREWDTDVGNTVPFVRAGDPVRVRAASTHTLVVSGRYHRSW